MLNIGERLKEEPARPGYNHVDFAAVAGFAKTSKPNYEKDERSPNTRYIAAVVAAGLDALYAVTGVNSQQPADNLNADESGLVSRHRQLPLKNRLGVTKVVTAISANC